MDKTKTRTALDALPEALQGEPWMINLGGTPWPDRDHMSGKPVKFIGADIPLPPPKIGRDNVESNDRTALDALLGALHEQYQKMNELCIDIMHSNLDLMRQIIELRMELAEGREDGPNDSSQDGAGLAAGAVDHGTV